MGKDLHYLVLRFFHERMNGHAKVGCHTDLQDERDILFMIERRESLPNLIVHLSDAYLYTLHDYYSKPPRLKSGDFILVARPEAKFDESLVAVAYQDKIGIGKIGKFLGALNRRNIWTYKEPG